MSDDEDYTVKQKERLYCLCRKPDRGEFMIACDGCDDWFHGKCVGIRPSEAEDLENWLCSACRVAKRKAENSGDVSRKKTKVDMMRYCDHCGRAIKTQRDDNFCSDLCVSSSAQRLVLQMMSGDGSAVAAKPVPSGSPRERTRALLTDALIMAFGEERRFEAQELGQQIEETCFNMYDTNQYRTKIRSILFNLKDAKNAELRIRVANGELTPEKIARLDTWDLASSDLTNQRTSIIQENEKNLVIEREEGPVVKKTHKGDEIMLPNTSDDPTIPIIPTVAEVPLPSSTPDISLPRPLVTRSPSSSPDRDDGPSIADLLARRPSHPGSLAPVSSMLSPKSPSQHQAATRFPSTPSQIPGWTGKIATKVVPVFTAIMKHLHGAPLHFGLSTDLEVAGRTPLDALEKFLARIPQSHSKQMQVMTVSGEQGEDIDRLHKFCRYFLERNRAATIAGTGVASTRLHLIPLTPQSPMISILNVPADTVLAAALVYDANEK